jgi:hypothetical protein
MIQIQFGPGNFILRPISHTSEITRDMIEGLGGSFENIEFLRGGVPYAGPLSAGDVVDCRQKANAKG